MIEVRAEVQVGREADDAFAFIADMSNNPRWQKGMQSCEWTSDPPLKLGSTYDQQASFLGRTIRSSFEVIEFEPARRIRIKTTGGSMPIDVTREVAANDDGCIVSAVVRGDSSGLFRLASPLMKQLVAFSVKSDYRRLKKLLEETKPTP